MAKVIKKMNLSAESSTEVNEAVLKGTPENPYTQEEMTTFGDGTWPGGFVEGMGYLPPSTIGVGSSSSNQYVYPQGTFTKSNLQLNYIFAEGFGLLGSYGLNTTIKFTGNSVFVSAEIVPPFTDTLKYTGYVKIMRNNNIIHEAILVIPQSLVYATGHKPLGSCTINLPASGNVSILLTICYNGGDSFIGFIGGTNTIQLFPIA
ncbi:MAG: hypothetical protein MJY95_01425 [Bacteroidaceae bacterium]|nr:hypothetical protein [Bacteroidaceae bacterium]